LEIVFLRQATPDYIRRYINGHGRDNVSDSDRRMRPHPGRSVDSGEALPMTTDYD